jgi:hypothetical protein
MEEYLASMHHCIGRITLAAAEGYDVQEKLTWLLTILECAVLRGRATTQDIMRLDQFNEQLETLFPLKSKGRPACSA